MSATTPRERPILFADRLVRAILAGRKTETRRVVKPQPVWNLGRWSWPSLDESKLKAQWSCGLSDSAALAQHARWRVGDRLWVREAWAPATEIATGKAMALYRADGSAYPGRWKPSIHLPRRFARLFLDVLSVRAERLHAITEAGAIAEGVTRNLATSPHVSYTGAGDEEFRFARLAFASLWDSINGKDPAKCWAADPWVWVVGFKRAEAAS